MYLNISDLNTIVIDVTSYCNAMCGNCCRNINGVDVNPNMPLSHMPFETWQRIFTPEVLSTIDGIVLNGSYGDPIFHPNLLEMLEHLTTGSKIPNIAIHTNGGLQTPEFFSKLAKTLSKFPFPTNVTFSIDGLEDTNHLYRRNVIWHKVVTNAKAFIAAGGNARWRMLVFEHNAHQIEQCESYAKELGFKKFDINGGHSFSAINSITSKAIEVFNASKKQKANVITYETNFLDNRERIVKIQKIDKNLSSAFSQAEIRCKWQEKRKIQISHTGEVFPCCYFLADRFPRDPNSPYAKDVFSIVNSYEPNWNNVNNFTIEEILNHEWFKNYLPNSWTGNKYEICSISCGHAK